jgi:hypothetical protein
VRNLDMTGTPAILFVLPFEPTDAGASMSCNETKSMSLGSVGRIDDSIHF